MKMKLTYKILGSKRHENRWLVYTKPEFIPETTQGASFTLSIFKKYAKIIEKTRGSMKYNVIILR